MSESHMNDSYQPKDTTAIDAAKTEEARSPIPPTIQENDSFSDFELPDELRQAISELGFTACTPIQTEILPSTLAGRDAFGRAQTGTGKTAAFLISIITRLLAN